MISKSYILGGEGYGRMFCGRFDLVLKTKDGIELDRVSLEPFFTAPEMTFNNFFALQLTDYNADGSLDFSIGQKETSQVYMFHIFSIIDSKIIQLTEGKKGVVSSLYENRYSELFSSKNNQILTSVYSRQEGKYLDKIYVWDGCRYTEKLQD